MAYYNTQQPQQNQPQQQTQVNQGQQTSGYSGAVGTQSTKTQYQPKAYQPTVQKQALTPQTQQQQAQGWTPTSPVNANGTLSTQPLVSPATQQPHAQPQQYRQGAPPSLPASSQGLDLQGAYNLVNQTFEHLFGRAPTRDELDAWGAGLLFGGRTPADMYQQLASDPNALPVFNPLNVPGNVSYQAQSYGNLNYTPQDYGSIDAPQMYGVNRPGAYNYQEGNIGQYAAQENPYAQSLEQIWAQLGNMPLGLPVEQMKAAQAETATELARQSGRTGMESMAARGIVNGGQAERLRQLIDADKSRQILGAYRDIDIQDALAQRDNAMSLLGLGDQLANSSQNRNIQDYLTALQGQNTAEGYRQQSAQSNQTADMAFQDFLARQYQDNLAGQQLRMDALRNQDAANQFGASFGLDMLKAQDAANQFGADFNRNVWNDQQSAYNQQVAQALQDYVARSGMNLDYDQFNQDKAQDRFSNLFDILSFLEGQRQFNTTSDLDKSQLDLSRNKSALEAAIAGRGQDIDLLNLLLRSGG